MSTALNRTRARATLARLAGNTWPLTEEEATESLTSDLGRYVGWTREITATARTLVAAAREHADWMTLARDATLTAAQLEETTRVHDRLVDAAWALPEPTHPETGEVGPWRLETQGAAVRLLTPWDRPRRLEGLVVDR